MPKMRPRDLGAARRRRTRRGRRSRRARSSKRDVREDAAPRRAPRRSSTTSPISASSLGNSCVERAADHQPDRSRLRELGRGRACATCRPSRRTVTRVGDARDLLEPMADEDDRDAARRAAADDREELLDLVRRERRRRLVHDQQAGARRERLGDLEQLPVGDAEAAHRRVGADVHPELAEDRARALVRIAPPVDRAKRCAAGGRRTRSRPR